MWETIRHSAGVKFGHRNAGTIVGGVLLLRVLILFAVVGGMLWAARNAGPAWEATLGFVADWWPWALGVLALVLVVKAIRWWQL